MCKKYENAFEGKQSSNLRKIIVLSNQRLNKNAFLIQYLKLPQYLYHGGTYVHLEFIGEQYVIHVIFC